MSWEDLGLVVASARHLVSWRYCCDLEHAWTGLVRLGPGQAMPAHQHTTPELYYILQVRSVLSVPNPFIVFIIYTIPGRANCDPEWYQEQGEQVAVCHYPKQLSPRHPQ